MTKLVRIYPISPRRGIVIFLSPDAFPQPNATIKFENEQISGTGTIDHSYIDFNKSILQDSVIEGTLTW